ncbi:unnamed protein product, partial [Rangifer tarandus platyrhynchus]
ALVSAWTTLKGYPAPAPKRPCRSTETSPSFGLAAVWTPLGIPGPRLDSSWKLYQFLGFPFLPPRDLPDPGIEPRSPSLQVDSLLSGPPGKPGTLPWALYSLRV